MSALILIRGLPGSGKTTLAKQMVILDRMVSDKKSCMIETDQFFEQDGIYKFDGSKIKEAHLWTQNRTRELLDEYDVVYVANTFTTKWEMEPYQIIAKENGAFIKIIECKEQYGNVHDVPEHVIKNMKERWEEL